MYLSALCSLSVGVCCTRPSVLLDLALRRNVLGLGSEKTLFLYNWNSGSGRCCCHAASCDIHLLDDLSDHSKNI